MSTGVGEIEEIDGKTVWKIPNFSTIQTDSKICCVSPVFTTPTPISNSPRLRWQLLMHSSDSKNVSVGYISIYVRCTSQYDVTAFVSLAILNDKNEKLIKRRLRQAHTFKYAGKPWGFTHFANARSLVNNTKPMLIDDTLRISCSLTFVNSLSNEVKDDSSMQIDHFKKLFNSGSFSDVTFVVGKYQLHLHKAILTGLSPVFQAMFEHDMKEKQESIVDITDISYDTIKEMFRYIYQRQVHNIKKIAGDLLVAADKYSLIRLKTLCEETLIGTLSIDNAVVIKINES